VARFLPGSRRLGFPVFLVSCALLTGTALARTPPLGSEFQVNTFTINSQSYPSVASSASGNFVVAWDSFEPKAFSLVLYGP
jgi:hypothetical protein